MSVVSSIIRAVLFGIIADVIIKGGLISTRYFRRNKGTTDYATIPEVTLAGDFKVYFTFLCGAQSSFEVVGQGATYANHINVLSTEIEVRIAGTRLHFTGAFQDSLLHSGFVERVSGVTVINIDGVEIPEDTLQLNTSTFTFDSVWGEAGVASGAGILANLKIYDNGTLIRDYPLDDNSDILANKATTLGEELWGSPSLQAPWFETADSYTIDGSQGGNASITVTGTAPATGTVVLCEVNVISKDARNPFAVVRDGLVQLQEGRNRILITAGGGGASRIQIVATSGGVVELEKSSISFKQADGYGTIINGNDEDKGLFTQQANGDWNGVEMAPRPLPSYTDGTIAQYGVITNGSGQALSVGGLYAYKYVVTLTSGRLQWLVGNNGINILTSGEFSGEIIAKSTGTNLIRTIDNDVIASISSSSLIEVLKSA